MSCELGIAPQYLIDLDTPMFKMMLEVMEDRAKGSQMPASVKGAVELRKALKAFTPDLAKGLTKDMARAMSPIVKTARGYMPNENQVLSNWGIFGKNINASSSAL